MQPMDPRVRRRIEAIEAEFGEPLRETILGLREGITWKNVAGALEMDEKTLRSYRRMLELPVNIRDRRLDETSVVDPTLTKAERMARALGYENAVDAIVQLRFVEKHTKGETARALGVGTGSIERHTPPELKGLRCYSAAGLEAVRESARRTNAMRSTKEHPWRRGENARVERIRWQHGQVGAVQTQSE